MAAHLRVVQGERSVAQLDTPYLRHPVHGVKAIEQKARETVAQAFGEEPFGPLWALALLRLAVDGNPVAILRHGEALEVLAAHLSKPAPNDDCDPRGIVRPVTGDSA